MRRLMPVCVLLVAGCQTVNGPRKRDSNQPVDNPCLTVEEQMRRGRDRLAFPDPSPAVGPRTYAEVPNALGR